ncbi:hypothetical protein Q9966_016292 [Columba livia]|nr:hypothetical protein Q9966_016292 [Columba livia]
MPTDKEVSCSSSCPQIGHSLGQHTLQSTWVTPSVQERLQDHHKGPQEGSGWPRSTNSEAAAEAECPAPAPQGPTADDAALWDTAQRIVSEAVRRAVAQIMAAGQEPEEQQDLAQHMDLQDENSKEGCQGGDTIQSTWINPSVQEHLQDAPAGPQEGSGLPSCTDTEAAAEAERPAPAQHSPTEDDVDLSDIVEYIVSEAVRRAEAEIQGPGQQPVEQQDLAQCTDVPMAVPAPAGLEAIEAHLAGEDERQASTAPLVPAAKEEEENTAVHEIINQALEKLEEMQVPMPDYALKSAGAAVIHSRTSPSLRNAKAKLFFYSLPLMDYMRSPELILEPENFPGNCWPFPGSQGHVFIKLSVPVIPRAVTMDHVSGTAFHGESISGAPKDFAVYGFKEEHEEQGMFLGQFTFLAPLNPSQTFQLKNELPGVMNYIRLQVLSNWGHPDYTCLLVGNSSKALRMGLLMAPCGCCFDPRVFRIQWTVPYNHQGTVVAAATPVLPTPIPSGYQSLEEKFARLSISSKATAAGTPPGSHVRPSCSAAPNNKAAGDSTSHLVVPKKTNLQDAQGKKYLSSVPKPEEQGRKRRHEQGHSPEPPSKRSTAMELPQSQAAPAEQRGRKRSHEQGHSPESEPQSKRRAAMELPQSQASPAEQRGRKRSHERGHSPEPEPPSKRRAGVAGGD